MNESRDLVTPDDVLSEKQLERFPGEPEKNRIGSPGHEEWVYEDGTRVYGTLAYGFMSDLVDDDVLSGERALTDIDMENLRYAAAQVKGAERPVSWIDADAYDKSGIEEELPLEGRFYFDGMIPMHVQMRGSDDLAERLSFLRSTSEADEDEVYDDIEELGEEDRGMIDRIDARLETGDFVVPVVYSNDGMPVRSREVAFVYNSEEQSGLNDYFSQFVKSLAEEQGGTSIQAEVDGYSTGREQEEKPVSIDPGMPDRPPELRLLDSEEEMYELAFDAHGYEDPGELDVAIADDEIRVIDGDGSKIAWRDVEFDRNLDSEDLGELEIEDLDVSNGVGTAVLSKNQS